MGLESSIDSMDTTIMDISTMTSLMAGGSNWKPSCSGNIEAIS